MARNDIMRKKIRGTSGKYLGRPSKCKEMPGEKSCIGQLNRKQNDLCRNCRATEELDERIKVFGRQTLK